MFKVNVCMYVCMSYVILNGRPPFFLREFYLFEWGFRFDESNNIYLCFECNWCKWCVLNACFMYYIYIYICCRCKNGMCGCVSYCIDRYHIAIDNKRELLRKRNDSFHRLILDNRSMFLCGVSSRFYYQLLLLLLIIVVLIVGSCCCCCSCSSCWWFFCSCFCCRSLRRLKDWTYDL